MQIECLKNNFLEKVLLLQGAIGKNVTLPILNNIFIQTENGRVKLATTNLEMGMTAWIGGKITEDGNITVPIKLLINVLSNITEDKIILQTNKNMLNIKGETFNISINGIAGSDFPIIPKIETEDEINILANNFKKAASKVISSVSVNTTRPELMGILFELSKKVVNFVGTDGFHLAKTSCQITKINNDNDLSVIIPSKTISEVLKCSGDSIENISIKIADNQILFSLSNISVVSRIIEGQYPPYSEIIPSKNNVSIFLNKEELIKAVKMAGFFTSNKTSEIIFSQKDKDKIEIKSSSQDIGENLSVLNADIKGDKIGEFVFNYKYLLDGISLVDSKRVCFSLKDANTPIVITPENENDANFLYLMMPLK